MHSRKTSEPGVPSGALGLRSASVSIPVEVDALHVGAEADVEEALQWFDSQRPGLGAAFLHALDSLDETI